MTRPRGGQVRPVVPWALVALVPAVVQVTVMVMTGNRPRTLIVDVAELSDDIGMFTGMFSMLGVVLWFAAATACWLAASLLREDQALRRPLVLMGALSVLLGVDDALVLHENLPELFGLPDVVWAAPAGVLAIWIVARHRHVLREEMGFAIAATVTFGVSVLVDLVLESMLESNASGVLFVEENAKLAGIFVWFGLCLHAARRAVAVTTASPGGQGAVVSSHTDDGGRVEES